MIAQKSEQSSYSPEIRNAMELAWSQLQTVYESGIICSERHMQCELFRVLCNDKAFINQYEIFVEPRLSNTDCAKLKVKIPDINITSRKEREIVAVMELKYVPHSYPQYEKDIEVLTNFYELCNLRKNDTKTSFSLLTNPETGEWKDDVLFPVALNLTLIYAVIGRFDSYVFEQKDSQPKILGKELWKNEGFKYYIQLIGPIGEYPLKFNSLKKPL